MRWTPCIFLAAILFAAPAAMAANISFDTLSYLGGSGDDAGGGVGILADHRVVYGGTATRSLDASLSIDVLGGGNGLVALFDADGQTLRSAARIGTAVNDLDVGGDRIAVAAAGAGPTVLAGDGRTVLWNDPTVTNAQRISVGSAGNVATLTTSKQLRLYGPTGTLLNTRQFGDSVLADVVVDDANGRVIVTGFNNKNTGQEPIQVPFIRAFNQSDLRGGPAWVDYDWAGAVARNEQNANVADSRGVRLELGRDGKLYFAARADGGNTTYLFDPKDVDRRLTSGGGASNEFIKYDKYSDAFNTQSQAKGLFGRYDAATGDIEHIQWLLTRTSNNTGNTLNIFGITADADGTIYLTGQAAATIKDRDTQQINGETVGTYSGGELFLARISPDFTSREFWTVLLESGGTNSLGADVAVLDGHLVFAGTQRNPGGTLFTVDAFQPAVAGGAEGYFGVLNAPAAPIPEPASLTLALLSSTALLIRPRPKRPVATADRRVLQLSRTPVRGTN